MCCAQTSPACTRHVQLCQGRPLFGSAEHQQHQPRYKLTLSQLWLLSHNYIPPAPLQSEIRVSVDQNVVRFGHQPHPGEQQAGWLLPSGS